MRATPQIGAYFRTTRCPCPRRERPKLASLQTPRPCTLLPQQGGIVPRGPSRPSSWRCCDASRRAVPPCCRAASSLSPWSSRCWRVAGDATDGCRGADLPAVGGIFARAFAGLNAALIWCVLLVFRVHGTGESRSHGAFTVPSVVSRILFWFVKSSFVMSVRGGSGNAAEYIAVSHFFQWGD